MKPLKTLLLLTPIFAFLGCSDDVEKKGADFHAEISGKLWTADKITVSAATEGELSKVNELVAKAPDGSSIVMSFEALGLTPEQRTASFRERSANITSFTGYYDPGQQIVFLNWETSFEDNVSYFEIQRSYDNIYYESIDYRYGYGTTNEPHSYSSYYYDQSNASYVYYRLRIIDYMTDPYGPTVKISLKVGVTFIDQFGRRSEGRDGEVRLTQYDPKGRVLSGDFSFKYTDAEGDEKTVSRGHFERVAY